MTLDLPDDALARLHAEAARRGVSIDIVIAELVGRLPADVGASPRRRLSFARTLSAEPELAERAEQILDEVVTRSAG